jgi:hypothetical protein
MMAEPSEPVLLEAEIAKTLAPSAFIACPHDLAKQYADLYSEKLEAPWDFWYFTFLTAFGVYVSNLAQLDTSFDVQPRLFTVLLGQSGDPRKSTVLGETKKFFEALDAEGDLPVSAHTLWGVGSAEGLGKTFKKSSKVLLVFDELRSFINVARREGSVLLPVVNTLFESNKYDNVTKSYTISIDNALLSMVAGSTTETFGSMFTSEFLAIGFLNRLWLVPADRTHSIPFPHPINPEARDILLKRTRDRIIAIHAEFKTNKFRPIRLTLTPEALDAWSTWYARRSTSVHATRLDAYGLRLCLLLTLVRGHFEVPVSIVEDVVRMLDWQLEARRDNDPIDSETKAALIEEKIRRVLGRGPQTKSQLFKLTNGRRYGVTLFQRALEALVSAGEVVQNKETRAYHLIVSGLKKADTPETPRSHP